MIVVSGGQKGGCGKTTLAVCLAVEYLRRGQRVLLVDADTQRSVRTWGQVAIELGAPAPTVVSMAAGMHRADQLPALAAAHDVTLVDCPPRLDAVQRSALLCADLVLLPSGPSAVEAWALSDAQDLVGEARALRPELLAFMVIVRRRPGTVMGRRARRTLEGGALPILDSELADRVTYPESLAAGRGPTTYDPASEAAREVKRLVTELERVCPPLAAATARRRREA